jgi:hypothetical protein
MLSRSKITPGQVVSFVLNETPVVGNINGEGSRKEEAG